MPRQVDDGQFGRRRRRCCRRSLRLPVSEWTKGSGKQRRPKAIRCWASSCRTADLGGDSPNTIGKSFLAQNGPLGVFAHATAKPLDGPGDRAEFIDRRAFDSALGRGRRKRENAFPISDRGGYRKTVQVIERQRLYFALPGRHPSNAISRRRGWRRAAGSTAGHRFH